MTKKKDSAAAIRRCVEYRFNESMPLKRVGCEIDALLSLVSHRSHRSYSSRPVDEGLLRLLLGCALSSPSKSDLQQADIIQIRHPGKRAALADLIPSMPWVKEAPVFLVFCGNGRRIRQLSELRGEVFANDHLDAFFNAAVDAAVVLATFVAAAESVGLGCCPISAVRNHCQAVDRLLELPDLVFPLAGMCVGYPDKEGHVSQRLPLKVTTHVDAFDESRLEKHVDAYDRRRAAAMPETERHHWSQAKAKQYSQPQRTDFGAYIRAKGFNLS